MQSREISIRDIEAADIPWVKRMSCQFWGGETIAVHGEVFQVVSLPGFIAEFKHEKAGLLNYKITDEQCEILNLISCKEQIGVGTALIERVKRIAVEKRCKRLWLITTNDNRSAQKFYQGKGFKIIHIHVGAVDESRKIKPQIPLTGQDGIPLHDEIEMETFLD